MRKILAGCFMICSMCMSVAQSSASDGGTATGAADNIHLNVLSATVRDKPVAGATVIFQKNGESSIERRTDDQGRLIASRPFSADDDSVHLIIRAPGYSTLVAKCPCAGLTYAMSETMTQLDGIRIVLSWGARPLDLDAHLVWPQNHVYFSHKNGTGARLDVDSRQGYGPETITIARKEPGQRYIYAVDTFYDDGSKSYGSPSALVTIYIGNSLVDSFTFSPGPPQTAQVLFDIDELGVIHHLDRTIRTPARSSSWTGDAIAAAIQEGASSINERTLDHTEDVARAKDLNAAGERAYHQGHLDTAIEHYREAISWSPSFGQAYSNLGLAYQKNDQIAEAIWANRKAISLASGAEAPRVRASSYYNIGRIYEAQHQWGDALYNYKRANAERPLMVYADAIERMHRKINER